MTKAYNPALVAKSLLRGEVLPAEFYFEHLDWLSQSAYGLSAALINESGDASIATKSSQDCFDSHAQAIDPETIFNIASITKPITVATILKMIEIDKFAEYFHDGLETKLSNLYSFLESRYPELDYIKSGRLRVEDPRISIKDLITHTSGIVSFDGKTFGQKLRFESAESLSKAADGKFLEPVRASGEWGKYEYSDVGYELLGMLISAIASDASKKAGGDIVTCGQAMRDLVIKPLGMTRTFTSDQLKLGGEERVEVDGFPDQKIARGYDCNYDGKITESLVFHRCIATSGTYSTPLDLCRFVRAVFSNKTSTEGGFFEKTETIKLQQSHEVLQVEVKRNEDGIVVERVEKKDDKGSDNYGVGFMFWVNPDGGNKLQYHGARTAGYSGWIGYRNGKAACCLVSCQNLTTYFARAKLESEICEGRIENTDDARHSRLYEINQELLEKYTKEELLGALRKAEFHPDKVREENDTNLLRELTSLEKAKKPRSFVEAAQAGKYGKMTSPGGAHEL